MAPRTPCEGVVPPDLAVCLNALHLDRLSQCCLNLVVALFRSILASALAAINLIARAGRDDALQHVTQPLSRRSGTAHATCCRLE